MAASMQSIIILICVIIIARLWGSNNSAKSHALKSGC